MGRNRLNFFVDLAIAVMAFCLVTTGLILRYVLPPGTGGRFQVLGWGRHDWGNIHFWLAVGIGVLALVHVALHWSWVCSILGRMIHPSDSPPAGSSGKARNVYGCVAIVLAAALVFGIVWLARSSIVESSGGGKGVHGVREGAGGGAAGTMEDGKIGRGEEDSFVRGSMMLQEVAERSQLSVDDLRARLGFPTDAPANEQIGRLARQHGLEMSAVRKALSANPGREEARSAAGTDTPPPDSPQGAPSLPGANR